MIDEREIIWHRNKHFSEVILNYWILVKWSLIGSSHNLTLLVCYQMGEKVFKRKELELCGILGEISNKLRKVLLECLNPLKLVYFYWNLSINLESLKGFMIGIKWRLVYFQGLNTSFVIGFLNYVCILSFFFLCR